MTRRTKGNPFLAFGASTPGGQSLIVPPLGNGFWGGFGSDGYPILGRLQPNGGSAPLIGTSLGFIFLLTEPWQISFGTISVGTGVAASTVSCGLYSYNPLNDATALVADIGAVSSAVSGTFRTAIRQGSVTLPAGWYVEAQTQSAGGVLLACLNFNTSIADQFNIYETQGVNGRVLVQGANNPSGGILPASLGALTGQTGQAPNPIACFWGN